MCKRVKRELENVCDVYLLMRIVYKYIGIQ